GSPWLPQFASAPAVCVPECRPNRSLAGRSAVASPFCPECCDVPARLRAADRARARLRQASSGSPGTAGRAPSRGPVGEAHAHASRGLYYLDFFPGPGRERMGIWLTRMPRYEGMIRARLQEQGLPGDLVYLALSESGFSNAATSRAKAVGMWQFMKGTARGYGLRVDSWVDERRDPYRATDAAVRHRKHLNDRF